MDINEQVAVSIWVHVNHVHVMVMQPPVILKLAYALIINTTQWAISVRHVSPVTRVTHDEAHPAIARHLLVHNQSVNVINIPHVGVPVLADVCSANIGRRDSSVRTANRGIMAMRGLGHRMIVRRVRVLDSRNVINDLMARLCVKTVQLATRVIYVKDAHRATRKINNHETSENVSPLVKLARDTLIIHKIDITNIILSHTKNDLYLVFAQPHHVRNHSRVLYCPPNFKLAETIFIIPVDKPTVYNPHYTPAYPVFEPEFRCIPGDGNAELLVLYASIFASLHFISTHPLSV